jgi:signal peptidase I
VKVTAALGGLAVAGLLWLFLAPASLGGVLSATAVSGTSMQPTVRTGDLVLLESLGSYHTGQVVAYRNPAVAHTFLHRIVGIDGGRYLMRGDRNHWLDPGRIVAADISGAMILRIPHGGTLVTWLQLPLHGAAVAGAVTALVALTGSGAAVRRRRHRRGRRSGSAEPHARASRIRPRGRALPRPAVVAAGAAVVLVASAAGAAAAFIAPASNPGRSVVYRQSAGLSYAARVPSSVAYPGGVVHTGDPVYLAIVRELDLRFRYDFTSSAPHRVQVAATLAAGLSDGSGWRRAVPLATSVQRRGDGVVVRARMSLADVRRLLAQLQTVTGMGSASHALSLDLRGQVAGTVAGRRVRAQLTDHVGMLLDPYQLQMGRPRSIAGVPQLAWKTDSHRFAAIPASPRRWTAAGLGVTVAHARAVLGATALTAAALLAFALYGRSVRRRHADDVALAEARHGRLIVPLAVLPELPSAPLEVLDMRSLVLIAQRYDAVILHHVGPGGECFLVVDGESVFRYARPAPGWELAILEVAETGPPRVTISR